MDNQEPADDSPPTYDDDEALLLASSVNPNPPLPPYAPKEPQEFFPPTGQQAPPYSLYPPQGVCYVGPPPQPSQQLHQQVSASIKVTSARVR